MIQIYSEPTFKRIGQNIVPIITEHTKKAESFVPNVTPVLTENNAGKFNNLRQRANKLAEELHITYEEALKELQKRGEQLIDLWA